MRRHLFLLLTMLCGTSLWAQPAQVQQKTYALDQQHWLHVSYRGNQLLYMGPVTCLHLQRCGPEGRHYVYGADGALQRVIDYGFSPTKQFEGVPDRVWTATYFDSQGRVQKIIHAERCGECDAMPTGIWTYFKNGKLLKRIHAVKNRDALLDEASASDAWEAQ